MHAFEKLKVEGKSDFFARLQQRYRGIVSPDGDPLGMVVSYCNGHARTLQGLAIYVKNNADGPENEAECLKGIALSSTSLITPEWAHIRVALLSSKLSSKDEVAGDSRHRSFNQLIMEGYFLNSLEEKHPVQVNFE